MSMEIHYLNSGDWVESLTAVVEHIDGSYELLEFADFVQEYPMPNDDDSLSEQSPSRVAEDLAESIA